MTTDDFGQRLIRIRSSLNKINNLMSDLRNMSMTNKQTPPKLPVYRTYAERKEAEEKIRKERNKQTHREYKLPPVPAPGKGKHDKYQARPGGTVPDPVPSAGDGFPTRDMEPVKLPVVRREPKGEFADVISIHRHRPRKD